jgi:hypothetical protein
MRSWQHLELGAFDPSNVLVRLYRFVPADAPCYMVGESHESIDRVRIQPCYLLANGSDGSNTAWVQFPDFSTLQLDQRPSSVDVSPLELDRVVSLFLSLNILPSYTVRNDLSESSCASAKLHLARGRE